MIKVVLFDVDNTLLSFSGYVKETMKTGFALFGLPVYQEYMYPIFEKTNNGLWKRLEKGELSFEELIRIRWNLIFQELNIAFDGKTFENYFREQLFHSAVLEPGAIEILDYLKQKYVLGIASNGPYEQQINRLRTGKLYDYFSYYFVSEKIGAAKPQKEFFDFCFKEFYRNGLNELQPEEVMIIGDSISSDIAGGKAYGLKTCLYNKTVNQNSEEAALADYIVPDLLDIKQIL